MSYYKNIRRKNGVYITRLWLVQQEIKSQKIMTEEKIIEPEKRIKADYRAPKEPYKKADYKNRVKPPLWIN